MKIMKSIGIKLRISNIYDKKWTSSIVYLLISVVTKEMEKN